MFCCQGAVGASWPLGRTASRQVWQPTGKSAQGQGLDWDLGCPWPGLGLTVMWWDHRTYGTGAVTLAKSSSQGQGVIPGGHLPAHHHHQPQFPSWSCRFNIGPCLPLVLEEVFVMGDRRWYIWPNGEFGLSQSWLACYQPGAMAEPCNNESSLKAALVPCKGEWTTYICACPHMQHHSTLPAWGKCQGSLVVSFQLVLKTSLIYISITDSAFKVNT